MDKLREEINKATDPYAKAVGSFILSMNLQTVPEGKTLKACMEAIKAKAKQRAVSGVAVVEDHMVYGWAAEYFGLVPDAPKAQTPVIHTPVAEPKHTDDLDFDLEELF